MALILRFSGQGFTEAKYQECLKRLEAAGASAPAGRLYHVCFGDPNNLTISDIWESRESFDKFAETVVPIVKDLGVEYREPEVFEVYNMIPGAQAAGAR
jgi:hypothetical protein